MKNYLEKLFSETAEKLDYLKEIDLTFSVPAQEAHGDLSTNAAMVLTKKLKRSPREIATEIIDHLQIDPKIIAKVEIAGPGFINFYFTPESVTEIVKKIIDKGDDFGKSELFKGKKAIVEFVSANPTGPLTVGHGRNAVIGDTISNLLEAVGYDVDREYYFNNAGRQMRMLGDSLRLRYLELTDDKIEFPEDYYQGEYIIDIAKKLVDEEGESLKGKDISFFKEIAEKEIFAVIGQTLDRINIKMKNYFNENDLYESGKIDEVKEEFGNKGLSYEKDDALWLKLSELGGEQDKVIVKSTGEPTYRLPDIAYHTTKFDRGYDLIVDLFGSDHAATYPDVLAGIKALGYDPEKVEVLIHQFVTVMQGGEAVKMSTRKANFITLDELIDDVGNDVVRYFFIMRSISSHLNFDLDVAKKQSDENPVFYLQYAHARISSILRAAADEKIEADLGTLNKLIKPEEQSLLKKLYLFEDEVQHSAENFEPNKIANYLESLAAAFHKFYTECRIIGSEKELADARLALIIAVKTVLKNGLAILGVSAPEKM